jgi:large repetitive protein
MRLRTRWVLFAVVMLLSALLFPASGQATNPGGRVFTSSADFALGTTVGVDGATPDQLQLSAGSETFPFIWVANSDAGTISKLRTDTGAEVGRYWSAPNGTGRNPSRTTVDQDGNVWVGNRDSNTVTKIALQEAGNCIDRNGNGVIETSTGSADVKAWTTAANPADECILMHVVLGTASGSNNNVRAVAIDHNNNVFVGMSAGANVYHVNGTTGALMGTTFTQPFSGNYPSYGAVVDADGNLWLSGDGNNAVVKHTFDGAGNHLAAQQINLPGWSYGMGLAADGYIWVSGWTYNNINKIRISDGVIMGTYNPPGANGLRGVAVTDDGDIWVASSYSNQVIRLRPDGTKVAGINVGSHPTGVAVDTAGKVWVTNYYSANVSRVDPATNTVDGTFAVGAGPYNYSDMTGSVVRNLTTQQGTWTVIHDGGTAGMAWGAISWTGTEPAGTAITGKVRTADTTAGLGGTPWTAVTNGGPLTGVNGRYIQLEMKLATTTDDVSPVLTEVTIDTPTPEGECTEAPVFSSQTAATVAAADALDIAFKWAACGVHVRDESVAVRVRNNATNTLYAGYTYAAGITIDDEVGQYHQAFSPATYRVPAGTRLKVQVYFGSKLKGTVYVNVM